MFTFSLFSSILTLYTFLYHHSFQPTSCFDKSSEIQVTSTLLTKLSYSHAFTSSPHSCLMQGLTKKQKKPWLDILAGFLKASQLPTTRTYCGTPEHGCPSALAVPCMIIVHDQKWLHKTKHSGCDCLMRQSHLSCFFDKVIQNFKLIFYQGLDYQFVLQRSNKNITVPLIWRLWSWNQPKQATNITYDIPDPTASLERKNNLLP